MEPDIREMLLQLLMGQTQTTGGASRPQGLPSVGGGSRPRMGVIPPRLIAMLKGQAGGIRAGAAPGGGILNSTAPGSGFMPGAGTAPGGGGGPFRFTPRRR